MKFKQMKSGEYDVAISEGGITVFTAPGAFNPKNVSCPKDMSKISNEELQILADKAVLEWEEFLSGNEMLKSILGK